MTLDYHSLCPPRPHMPALAPVTAMAEDAIVDRRGRAGRDARLLPDPAATRGDGAAHDPCPRSWPRSARSVTCGTGCRRTTAPRGPTCSPRRSTGPTWRRARCPGSATRRRSGCSPGTASRPRTSRADSSGERPSKIAVAVRSATRAVAERTRTAITALRRALLGSPRPDPRRSPPPRGQPAGVSGRRSRPRARCRSRCCAPRGRAAR